VRPAAQVENDAIPTCGLGRTLEVRTPLGTDLQPSDNCAGWADTWAQKIASFDPDVVVVQYTVWEIESRRLPDGRWARPGDPALDRWQLSEYQAAADVLSARGAPVLWFNSASPRTWGADDVSILVDVAGQLAIVLAGARARELRALAERDLRSRDAILQAVSRSAERFHFSDAGAPLLVAQWLMPIVLGQQAAAAALCSRRAARD
jgi:hypothetical protein